MAMAPIRVAFYAHDCHTVRIQSLKKLRDPIAERVTRNLASVIRRILTTVAHTAVMGAKLIAKVLVFETRLLKFASNRFIVEVWNVTTERYGSNINYLFN